jgi:N-sulfoglucosamine sulfohydrolase
VRDKRFKLISSPRPGTVNHDARTYLDESHPHFVVSGATSEEQAAAPPRVREAFRRWMRPPRYELYDLQADPYEWNNLAEDPQHAEVKVRLIDALVRMQRDTCDPFLDRENVDAYVAEQLAHRDLAYRRQRDFRWSYLDIFPKWRAACGNGTESN